MIHRASSSYKTLLCWFYLVAKLFNLFDGRVNKILILLQLGLWRYQEQLKRGSDEKEKPLLSDRKLKLNLFANIFEDPYSLTLDSSRYHVFQADNSLLFVSETLPKFLFVFLSLFLALSLRILGKYSWQLKLYVWQTEI